MHKFRTAAATSVVPRDPLHACRRQDHDGTVQIGSRHGGCTLKNKITSESMYDQIMASRLAGALENRLGREILVIFF